MRGGETLGRLLARKLLDSSAMSLYGDSTFAPDGPAGLYVKPKLSPRDVIVRDASGRILYAVAGLYYRRGPKGTAVPAYEGPLYFSASDQKSAEYQFKQRFWHLQFAEVFAGPAIGFFVHDSHGDKLSAGGTRPDANPLDKGTEYEGQT